MIIKRKTFSVFKKLGAGIKGAVKNLKKYAHAGVIGGSALAFIPALIASIFGKKKAFLITEALGAGVGLGFLMYLGYKEGIEDYNYNKKISENPELKKAEETKKRKELVDYITNKKNYSLPNSSTIINNFHKVERECNVLYNKDLFKYVKYYESFYKKYYNKWDDVFLKYGTSVYDIDLEFNYIFPEPVFEYDIMISDIKDTKGNDVVGFVAGSLENSDHGYLFYHFNDKIYSFDLGYGYDSNSIVETLIKRCNNYRDFYDKNKTSENYLNIVKVHTEIIDDFINGLRNF